MADTRRTALRPVIKTGVMARIGLAPVLHFLGIVLCCLAALMMIPALVDSAYGHPDYRTFLGAATVTCFVGVSLTLAFSGNIAPPRSKLSC